MLGLVAVETRVEKKKSGRVGGMVGARNNEGVGVRWCQSGWKETGSAKWEKKTGR